MSAVAETASYAVVAWMKQSRACSVSPRSRWVMPRLARRVCEEFSAFWVAVTGDLRSEVLEQLGEGCRAVWIVVFTDDGA
jgi:hypothetical protein